MSDLQWTEEMSVGVKSIDTDHRLLLGLVNQLSEAIRSGRSQDVISSVLDALLDYTAYHFRREEALMRACGYPDVEAHVHTHHVLQKQVAQIRDRHVANPEVTRHREVQAFLTSWLTAHIMGRDKLYAPFMASRAEAVEGADRAYAEDLANKPRTVARLEAGRKPEPSVG